LSTTDYKAGRYSDQVGGFQSSRSRDAFPFLLRRIRLHGFENQRCFAFQINNLETDAPTIVRLYNLRRFIEHFSKWIKDHPGILHYYGTSVNDAKTLIWALMAACPMVEILHKQIALPGTLH